MSLPSRKKCTQHSSSVPVRECPRCGAQLVEHLYGSYWMPWLECVECCTAWTVHRRELHRGREPRVYPHQVQMFD